MSLLAAASTSSGSSISLFLPLVLFAGIYFLVLRPRANKAKAAQAQARLADVGDRVMMTSGMLGRVVGINDETVAVEVSPDLVLTFAKRAISRRLDESDPLYVAFDPDTEEDSDDDSVEDESISDEATEKGEDASNEGEVK
ncbi:MAG: preprotein translocase subunit YajC [Actinomycetota bacterium]|nr:preprotein translocase subunit YajC [Actinomycetota bacterium]